MLAHLGARLEPKDTLSSGELGMSFGSRLTLFVVLIVLVPTVALLGILLAVGEESRSGKADARLAAGLETATALFSEQVSEARSRARALGEEPGLAAALRSGERAELAAFARSAVRPPVEAIEVLDEDGTLISAAGDAEAIAFAEVGLRAAGRPAGALRVSTTDGEAFAQEVGELTGRDYVLSRNGRPIAASVTAPSGPLAAGETADVEADGRELRAHLQTLDPDDDETLLLLGPRKEGRFLALGLPAVGLLLGFLIMAIAFAYWLANALTRLHGQVEERAATDSLTGVWNRRRMEELLEREVDRALRFEHQLSVLIVDIDDFKTINDLRGHLQGDAALKAVADVLDEGTRSIDIAARWAGDEFALVLIETGAEGARLLAERLCASVRDVEVPLRTGGTMGVTISIGAATLPGSADDAESLLEAADMALLRAKRAGKDQIRSAPRSRFRQGTVASPSAGQGA
jgi:diguanylate cyclase (GGDEF)-like protein